MTDAAIAVGPYLAKSRRALTLGLEVGNTWKGGPGGLSFLRTYSTAGMMAFNEIGGSAIWAAGAGCQASAASGTRRPGPLQ